MEVLFPDATGLALVAAVYGASFVLNAFVPVRSLTPGYCIDHATGKTKEYRLNAFTSLVLMCTAWLALVAAGIMPGDVFYRHFASCAKASCAIGLVFSSAMYVRGRGLLAKRRIDRRERCPTVDAPGGGPKGVTADFDSRGPLMHFYAGLSEFNPSLPWGVDAKMWLYLAGAVQLQLNTMSAVAAALEARGNGAALAGLNPGLLAYAGMLTFFVFEYCWHEHVHTYTYDLFRERIGFKLTWGCLCFYPFFYPVGVFPLVHPSAAPLSPVSAGCCVALFAVGYVLTRGANLQKFACKTGAPSFAWGLVPMATLPGSKGRILISGFWGASRHVNYLGEVLQALSLSLPGVAASGSPLPLLYPLYYVALFVPRALDDDAQCEAKYGAELWAAYRARVPWRIVPGLW